MPASGTRRLGAYQLISPLATGGMAELFVAKTAGVSGFEKQVALKVIHPNYSSDPEFVRMLVDEAKLAVQLQHANIVQTYDLGQVDGQYYIAMELIDGADLYKALKTASEKSIDFPIDVAVHIASEVATGLDYAHRKSDPLGRPLKIVHRDVSPQNVLVSREGEVKIVDFGIAKAALRGQHTQAGVIKGKYFYMSPEQAWGDKIDSRTDVFSTGILLYEMLIGEMLYLEDDLDKLLAMVRAADIAPPSKKRKDVPADLDAIVMKALAKRPEDRFQSAADFATALTRYLRQNYPDSGRARVARFVSQATSTEKSVAEVTLPPVSREDFGDENSLIFSLKEIEDNAAIDSSRGVDEETRGVTSPHVRGAAGEDFEGGATEFDARPVASPRKVRDVGTEPDGFGKGRKPSVAPDFGAVGDDAEPTEFAGGKAGRASGAPADFSGTDEEWSENQETGQRPNPQVVKRPIPAPPVKPPRRPAPPPIASRRPSIPPRAPARPGERERNPTPLQRSLVSADGGERALEPGSPTEPISTSSPLGGLAPTPVTPQPALGFGSHATEDEMPAVDWSASSTVTPATAAPYPRSGEGGGPASLEPFGLSPARKKLLLVVGSLLGLVVLVLSIAFVWSEGPARGTAEVVSRPPGASVRIDGTPLSKLTPIRISDLDVHQVHHVAVSLRGYDTWERDVKFETNERDVQLQAILVPSVGTLTVSSIPAGAETIVNQHSVGTTPMKVNDLPPNEDVTLELRLRGYKVATRTLTWNGKRELAATVTLEKAR